jgi:hypothetical protein
VNYVDDKQGYWYAVDFLDCRAKVVKDAAAMKPDDRGALKWCFMQPNAKLKDFPMIKAEKGSLRAVKAGNVFVVVSLGMKGMETLKAADVTTRAASARTGARVPGGSAGGMMGHFEVIL